MHFVLNQRSQTVRTTVLRIQLLLLLIFLLPHVAADPPTKLAGGWTSVGALMAFPALLDTWRLLGKLPE